MKNKCFLLVINRLAAQTGINEIRYGKDSKKRNNKILLLVTMLVLFPIMAFYMGAAAYGMCYLGLAELVPILSFFISSVVTLVFTVFKAPGELFGYRDYDFLMSIPVKTSTVIASRFMNLYLWNTFLSILVMLPMGSVYAVWERPDARSYLLWIVGMLIVSLIPTTISVMTGSLVTAVSSRFRHFGIVSAALLLLLTCAILVGSFSLSFSSISMKNGNLDVAYIKKMLDETIRILKRDYPPAGLFSLGVLRGNLPVFLLLVGLSIGCYLLFVWAISFRYKKINSAVSASYATSTYHIHGIKQKSISGALYRKEIRRWTGCTVYFTNTVTGVMMAILLSGALMLLGPDKLAELLKEPAAAKYMLQAGPYAAAAFLGMCCTTMASVSLEGKSLWILQSMPVDMKAIMNSKILVNLTATVPGALISATMLVIGMKPGLVGGVVYYLLLLAFGVGTAVWGLLINLMMPDYEWESETQVVKQNLAAFLGMFPFMLLGVLFGAVSVVLPVDYRLTGLCVSLLLFVASYILYIYILKKYKKMPV